jgi:hypothetical protein
MTRFFEFYAGQVLPRLREAWGGSMGDREDDGPAGDRPGS